MERDRRPETDDGLSTYQGGNVEAVEVTPFHLGGWRDFDHFSWVPQIWERLLADFSPSCVLDIGCGTGMCLDWWERHGIKSTGIDGDPQVATEWGKLGHKAKLVTHDYTTGPSPLKHNFDIVLSTEFLEHVGEMYQDSYMEDFARAPIAVVTAAPPGQIGHHHVNCRHRSYWQDVFSRFGFTLDNDYTQELRSLVEDSWFRRSGMVFRK